VRAVLDRPLSKDAVEDARAVFGAIRKGSVFSVIDALASPALLDFHAVPSGATVTLMARATVAAGGQLVLLGPAGEVARGTGSVKHEVPAEARGAYRVEVHLADAPGQPPVPWLVSNAFDPRPDSGSGGVESGGDPPPAAAPFPWRIEKDPASSAILRTAATSVELEYRLADGARNSQFVALASDVHGQAFRAIDFDLRPDGPSRIGVQVRTEDGQRWGRSFYVDAAGSVLHVELEKLRAVGAAPAAPPRGESVTSILLVVDLTNAAPGRSGRLTVRSSALIK